MKKITIEIETENAAFTDNIEFEIARILQDIVIKLDAGWAPVDLPGPYDSNGNCVGKITFE